METDKKTYNKEIDEAVERVNNGQFVSNEEVMKEIDELFVKPVIFLDHDGVICLSTEWGSRFKNKEGRGSKKNYK